MDHGFLVAKFTEMINTPEYAQLGLKDMMQQSLNELAAMRPIDIALNVLTMVIIAGFVLGMPIAAFIQKGQGARSEGQEASNKSKIENQ